MLKKLTSKDFWTHSLLALCIAGLLGGYLFLLNDFKKVKDSVDSQVSTQPNYLPGGCDQSCRAQIEAELQAKINSANSNLTPTPSSAPTPASTSVPKVTTTTWKIVT